MALEPYKGEPVYKIVVQGAVDFEVLLSDYFLSLDTTITEKRNSTSHRVDFRVWFSNTIKTDFPGLLLELKIPNKPRQAGDLIAISGMVDFEDKCYYDFFKYYEAGSTVSLNPFKIRILELNATRDILIEEPFIENDLLIPAYIPNIYVDTHWLDTWEMKINTSSTSNIKVNMGTYDSVSTIEYYNPPQTLASNNLYQYSKAGNRDKIYLQFDSVAGGHETKVYTYTWSGIDNELIVPTTGDVMPTSILNPLSTEWEQK